VHAAEDDAEWVFVGWYRNTAGRYPSFVMAARDGILKDGLPREYHASIASTLESRFPDLARYRRSESPAFPESGASPEAGPSWNRLDAAVTAIASATPATIGRALQELEAARSSHALRIAPSHPTGEVDGAEMKRIRTSAGMTQDALAEALGMTATYVGLMERGRKPIERRTALALKHIERSGGAD
jgi:DNA-binding transcriptional regulator YiaG